MTGAVGGPPIAYRPLRRNDRESYLETVLSGIGNLERATGIDANAEEVFRSLFRLPVWTVTRFLRGIGRPVVDVEVALDGPRVVGTGTILWIPAVAYVAGMVTLPEYRGRGIATQILTHFASKAAAQGREWLALDVESENETAIRLYRKAGYREVAEFSWLTRTGAPDVPSQIPPGVRPMQRSDGDEVAEQLDAGRPEPYRSVFPARPRLIDHNEFLVRGPQVRSRTWVLGTSGGSLGAVRAYFSEPRRLGAIFLEAGGSASPTADELAGLVSAAASWLATNEPARCLAVAREPAGPVRAALERAGFVRVVASTTMVRETPR